MSHFLTFSAFSFPFVVSRETETQSMAEWSQLPKELLDEIAKRLESPLYLVRFRSVCSSWRSSISLQARILPGLFPFLPNDGISDTTWGFYLSKRSVFLIGFSNTHSLTNPNCWLMKIEENTTRTMHLLNPLSRIQIKPLPEDFPKVLDISNLRVFELGQEYVLHYVHFRPLGNSLGDAGNLYMEKVVFKNLDSKSDDFALLTIHVSGKLAMFKSGDKRWSIVNDMPSPYDDVILFNDSFYAVDGTGRAVTIALCLDVSLVANPVFGGDKKFLVESKGELLMVDKYLTMISVTDFSDEDYYEPFDGIMGERTVKFNVYKLDGGGQKWVEVKNLGDQVLFLGDDCTFSASAFDLSGCKNCIFFTDNFFNSDEEDNALRCRDIAIYELESGKIVPLTDYPEYSKLFWPPPDWVTLNASGVSVFLSILYILCLIASYMRIYITFSSYDFCQFVLGKFDGCSSYKK